MIGQLFLEVTPLPRDYTGTGRLKINVDMILFKFFVLDERADPGHN